jgi:hypothetical protein
MISKADVLILVSLELLPIDQANFAQMVLF